MMSQSPQHPKGLKIVNYAISFSSNIVITKKYIIIFITALRIKQRLNERNTRSAINTSHFDTRLLLFVLHLLFTFCFILSALTENMKKYQKNLVDLCAKSVLICSPYLSRCLISYYPDSLLF